MISTAADDADERGCGDRAGIRDATAIRTRARSRNSKLAGPHRAAKLLVGVDSDRRYLDLGDTGGRERNGRHPLPARLMLESAGGPAWT